jgi:hypothetical protein
MRYERSDHEWAVIKPMLPNKPRGVPRVNDRRVRREGDYGLRVFHRQRIGYATGGATAGIIANFNGFSGGFTRETAATAAVPLFIYFIPLALLGCLAAFRLTKVKP